MRVAFFTRTIGALCAAALLISCDAAQESVATAPPPPDFSGIWEHPGSDVARPPEDGSPGPVQADKTDAIMGDPSAPILQPWAADVLRKLNAEYRAGREMITSQNLCLPVGVPRTGNIGPFALQWLQTPEFILILHEWDTTPRFIYLNEDHPKNLKPTWNGHSVGKWEGDTLVVDTVGMNDKTAIDKFGTPHTDRLHVVERYRFIEGGKKLELRYTVEDPGAYTTPWTGITIYSRAPQMFIETICAENNREEMLPHQN